MLFAGYVNDPAACYSEAKSAQDPSVNFVGVTDGLLPGRTDAPHYLAASTAVGPLRVGTHAVEVAVHAGHLFVSVDGALRIDTPVTLPARVRPGFTAATGGADDRHVVRGVAVTSAQEGIDTTAPAVKITSPTAGARVSGTTTVTASAVDDDSGVASVRFSLDGQPLGVTATAAPYQVRWGTTRVPNGRHTLAAVAVDAAGNTATAAPVTITVDNPLPVETSASADGKGNVTVSRFSTAHTGDVVLALVGAGGPAGKRQATSVTGGGLTWSLRSRANTIGGVAEVWQAVAPKALTKITITAKPVRTGYDTSLTVLALTGTRGVVRATGRSATTGLPSAALVTAAAGSWLVSAGEDPTAARAHTPASGQSLVHQWLDTRTRRTFWFQLASPDAAARATVRLSDVAPKTDAWNLVVVEVGRR